MSDLPEEFLRGIELFNRGRFFECHEIWETIWLKAEGENREFLHALIQTAAALHHLQRGNLKGALSVGERAIGKFKELPLIVMQIDTGNFLLAFESFLRDPGAPLPHISLQDKNP